MRRRIIKQGNRSFTLTLPIDWVREQNIEEGQEVIIEQEEGSLKVNLPKSNISKEKTVSFDLSKIYEQFDRTAINVINHAYRKGYNKIVIRYSSEEQLDIIKRIVQFTLLGFDVVDTSNHRCVISSIAEPSSENFINILKKSFFIVQVEGDEILRDLENGVFTNMKHRQEVKDQFDNYSNFLKRLIVKDKIGGYNESYNMYTIKGRLFLLQHAYFYMYKYAATHKVQVKKSTLSLLKKTNEMFELLRQSFFEKDLQKLHKVAILKQKLLNKEFYDTLEKSKGKENIVLHHIGEIIRFTHLTSTHIFGLIDLK